MGIQGLSPFLKKKCPTAFNEVQLNKFANEKVAVDISLYLYKYKVVFGDSWVTAFVNLISCLRKNEINPVFIYDGEAPIEKLEEQQSRRQVKSDRKDKVVNIQKMLDVYDNTGVISTELQEFHDKHKSKVESQSLKRLLGNNVENNFDKTIVEKKLEDLNSQNISITKDDIQSTMEILTAAGIPYYQAPSEAEAFCAYLCVMGKVAAVLSEDSDVLTYGACSLLTKINTSSETCIELTYNDCLEGLSFTNKQFTDFCIMLGCDYNSRVKGFGPVKCFNLLTEYKDIETIETKVKNDLSCLKWQRTRELFEVPDVIDYEPELSCNPVKEDLHTVLFKNKFRGQSSQVYVACLSKNNDNIENKQLIKPVYVARKSPGKKTISKKSPGRLLRKDVVKDDVKDVVKDDVKDVVKDVVKDDVKDNVKDNVKDKPLNTEFIDQDDIFEATLIKKKQRLLR